MSKTLTTIADVLRHSEFRDTFPPCDIKSVRDVELQIAVNVLGWDFYQLLLANLTNTEGALEWQNGTSYPVNQIVKYKGDFYTAIRVNSVQPPTATDWKLTPKFQNACYETFWCEHLARVISLSVFKAHSPLGAAQLTGKGWAQFNGNDSMAASDKSMRVAMNGIDGLIELARNAMFLHVEKINAECKTVFEKFKLTNNACGCEVNNSSKYVSAWA